MAYEYPKISNCLGYRKCEDGSVEVTDYMADETVYSMEAEEARFARKLDGKTNPYSIRTSLSKAQIDCLMDELDNCDLLKKSRKTVAGAGNVLWGIWEIKTTRALRFVAMLCNALLLLTWLPVLVVGVIVFWNNYEASGYATVWIGYLTGLLVGMFCHECGHAFAGIAYGARVFEMGVMRMYYVIPGAYVIMSDKNVRSRLKRIHINAAGVEANLLLVGIFLILSVIFKDISFAFLVAAVVNLLCVVMNLTLVDGFDGTAIIGELLGIDDIVSKAKSVVYGRRKRKKLMAQGFQGKATIAISYVIYLLQAVLPVLFLVNIVEVILCFV